MITEQQVKILTKLQQATPTDVVDLSVALSLTWREIMPELTGLVRQGLAVQGFGGYSLTPSGAQIVEASQRHQQAEPFQVRAWRWLRQCFSQTICEDRRERCDCSAEEFVELLQSLGYSKQRLLAVVDYVYSRPAGEPMQELGGTMTTLAVLCEAHGLDMQGAAEIELQRIAEPVTTEKIRAKNLTKPRGPALPE